MTHDAQKVDRRRAMGRRCVGVSLDVAGSGALVFGVVDVLGRGWASIVAGCVALSRAYAMERRNR